MNSLSRYASQALLGGLVLLGSAGGASAVTTSSQFNVLINVQPSCTFTTAPTDLNFGSVASSGQATGSTEFDLQCTTGTAPVISLTSGNSWTMKGVDTTPYNNTSATIAYTLYSDSSYSTQWDDTHTKTAVNDGSAQHFTVYGKVPATGTVVGNFKDTVTVTLTY
ncbi:Csu type fimbrial protein [Candidimonas nitroreducens]|uniref:Spore coat protein U/FanG domain-containing protein n=1 Tax=Candidimonas nitroreducens TaxID=683354 RepID=A0A225M4W0_9BURK|nr:spore coat protein U domain-containing protein [Candidimonas nitroreducens]OWT55160.1 hypothetical protein CEY11_20800 [Candidimonas nitroreducens]